MCLAFLLLGLGVGMLVGLICGMYDIDRGCENPDCEHCPFPRCDDSDWPLMWDSEKKSKRPK